jgi:acetyl esterase/lipase
MKRYLLIFCLLLILIAVPLSAQQRNVRPTDYNVIYGGENRSLRLDVYLPEVGAPPYPVALMFHGSPGDKSELSRDGIVQIILNESYAAVPVNYTTLMPDFYADGFCALAWVYANAEAYGFDTERVALFGVSFGGLVVAGMAAMDDGRWTMEDCPNAVPDGYEFAGVIANAGVFDVFVEGIIGYLQQLDPSTVSVEALAEAEPVLRENPPSQWRGLDLAESVHGQLQYFPIYWVNGGEPPHLLIHGLGDSNVPYLESLEYARVLAENGINVQLVFDRLSGHVPAPRIFDQELATFLHRIFDE